MERNIADPRLRRSRTARRSALTVWGDDRATRTAQLRDRRLRRRRAEPPADRQPRRFHRARLRAAVRRRTRSGLLAKAQIGVERAARRARPKSTSATTTPPSRTGQGFALWEPELQGLARPRRARDPVGRAERDRRRAPPADQDGRAARRGVLRREQHPRGGGGLPARPTPSGSGSVKGLGWYVQLSAWPFGDAFVNGDPGVRPAPDQDRSRRRRATKPKTGLELLAHRRGHQRDYDGASRGGAYDAKTPGAGGDRDRHQRHAVRLRRELLAHEVTCGVGVNYIIYHTPGSGSGRATSPSCPAIGDAATGRARAPRARRQASACPSDGAPRRRRRALRSPLRRPRPSRRLIFGPTRQRGGVPRAARCVSGSPSVPPSGSSP